MVEDPVLFSDDNVDTDDDDIAIPEDIISTADTVRWNPLPDKSKNRYERTYSEFRHWHGKNKLKSYSQRVMLAYFSELSLKCKPSSLWAYYSMLKRTLKIKHDVDFQTYAELGAFLQKKSKNYKPTQAKVFTTDQIKEFITKADDETWLDTKVRRCSAYLYQKNEEVIHPNFYFSV